MTIIELINKVKFQDVIKALKYHYPNPKIGKIGVQKYNEVFETIKKYKSNPDKNWILRVYFYRDDYDGEEGYSVDAFETDKKEQKYAIEFSPWKKTSNYILDGSTLKFFSSAEIVAHYLWEITYISFDENKIQKELSKLVETVKDIKGSKKCREDFQVSGPL
jgi:hypothetical protein